MDVTPTDSTRRAAARRSTGAEPSALRIRAVHSPDLAWADALLPLGSGPLRIGRAPEHQAGPVAAIGDSRMSRTHATLYRREDVTLWVRDEGSRNGTYLNARTTSRAKLATGDVLRLGSSVFVVESGRSQREDPPCPLLGRSEAINALREIVGRAAPTSLSVLVTGPTGGGKELVARELHRLSGRPGPLRAINCSAIPPTLVESTLFGHVKGAFTDARGAATGLFGDAQRGTVFLDEVGELTPGAQAKLLRAVDCRRIMPVGSSREVAVDVRVVAATNIDLTAAVERGEFRADLLARLAGIPIEVPPLTARREDVLLLFRHFLSGRGRRLGMAAGFAEALLVWRWPHNVRGLANLATRLDALYPDAGRWELDHLPAEMSEPIRQRQGLQAALVPARAPRPTTREELLALLERCDGSVREVAALTGRGRRQVYRWMKRFDVRRPSRGGDPEGD